MKANDNKYHLHSSFPDVGSVIQIENSTIKCSKVKKIIGVQINYKLKLDIHVETICKNT